jgi:hypothetical protein
VPVRRRWRLRRAIGRRGECTVPAQLLFDPVRQGTVEEVGDLPEELYEFPVYFFATREGGRAVRQTQGFLYEGVNAFDQCAPLLQFLRHRETGGRLGGAER